MFLYIKINRNRKRMPTITYCIFLKDKTKVEADDLLKYYKSKYVSIIEIIKDKNINTIIEDD